MLTALVGLAAITNAAIVCYASNQVELIIGEDATSFVGGHNATSLAAFVVLEHALFAVFWLVDTLVA